MRLYRADAIIIFIKKQRGERVVKSYFYYICIIKNTVAVTRGAVRQTHYAAVASVKIKPE